MADYICKRCGKDLGKIAEILLPGEGSGSFDFLHLIDFHERIHWQQDLSKWHELLEAARDFVGKSRGAANVSAMPRLIEAVEALKVEIT